jgi:hypothetical protein
MFNQNDNSMSNFAWTATSSSYQPLPLDHFQGLRYFFFRRVNILRLTKNSKDANKLDVIPTDCREAQVKHSSLYSLNTQSDILTANREMLQTSSTTIDSSLQDYRVNSSEILYEVRRAKISGKKSYTCRFPGCHGEKRCYGRRADWDRHYREAHAAVKESYPCPVEGCKRQKAFSRKGNMINHITLVHGAELK